MGQRRSKRTAAGVAMEVSLTPALNATGIIDNNSGNGDNDNNSGNGDNDNNSGNGNNFNNSGLGDKGSCQSIGANNSGKRFSSRACKETATHLADIQNTYRTRRQRSKEKNEGKSQVGKQIGDGSGSVRAENGSGGENPSSMRRGRSESKTVEDIMDKENKEIVTASEGVFLEDGSCTKNGFVSGQAVSPVSKRGSKRRSIPDSGHLRRSKRKCVQNRSSAGALTEKNIVNQDDKADADLEKQPTEEANVMLSNDPPERQPSPGTEAGVDNVETGSNSVPDSGEKMVTDVLVLSSDDDRSTKGLSMKERSLHQSQDKEEGHSITNTIMEMQQMYSKLHAKYQKLKARRHDDIEAYIGEQNKKFTAYVNAAEELLEHLRNDNNRLRLQANDANSTMSLNRSLLLERKTAEFQNELLIERAKNSELMEEVKRLQQLLSERGAMKKNVQNNNLNGSNHCFSVSEEQYSCSQENSVVLQSERQEAIADLSCVGLEDFSKICPSNPTVKHVAAQGENFQTACHNYSLEGRVIVDEPKSILLCNAENSCVSNGSRQMDSQFGKDAVKGDATNLGLVRVNGLLQSLLQCMVGLKFFIADEGKLLQLFILHQSSGYSFKLKCLSAENDPKFIENGELLYHVVSLGTLQKIAPDWMKEEIIFSVGQVNLFFDRILQVANGHGHNLLAR